MIMVVVRLHGRRHRGGRASHGPFLSSKKQNWKQRKKRKSFKAKTIKMLSPSSKCSRFSHSRASRIQNFSSRSTMVADNTFQCFVALPLWNPFCRPWASDNVSGVLEIIIMKLDYIFAPLLLLFGFVGGRVKSFIFYQFF